MKNRNAIGGFFELELPPRRATYLYSDALKFISCRAAFYAFLLAKKPAAVWMPRYICDSMFEPLKKAQVRIKFYSVGMDLLPVGDIQLEHGELLLYVNYFGVCEAQELKVIDRFGAKNVVCDHSQAFYSPPKENVAATLYSPRKFFGVPDGGLLITNETIHPSKYRDATSLERSQHLLGRHASGPEPFYEGYLINETALSEIRLDTMSELTEKVLSTIDYDTVAARRKENLHYYLRNFAEGEEFTLPLESVPLVFPLKTQRADKVRERLASVRIYTASYWPEVNFRDGISDDEILLANNIVALPLDQRYTPAQIKDVISVVNAL